MEHKALSSILRYFAVRDGRLLIGGRTCAEIAAEVGTPFYAYDLGVARKKYERLRAALPDEVEIHYAVKANPHPEIVRFFRDLGCGFDVASAGELRVVLDAGANPAAVGFAGPGKREFEIREACRAGIGSLNVESEAELELADRIAGEEGRRLRVAIRVNPAYELVGSGMKMGGGPKPFGIDQENVPRLLARFPEWPNLGFAGFHIFAGSQNLRAEAIVAAFEGALSAVASFLPHCPNAPELVNLGGGFGIPHYAADNELDIEAVGAGLGELLERHRPEMPRTRLVVETGRYLVGECGVYVCRVLYRKESRGQVFLVLDGGLHHNQAACGNFGQVIKRNFPICAPEKIGGEPVEEVNLVGPLCTPLDRLGSKVEMPRLDAGALVAVMVAGAYGFTASPRSFLGHPEPGEAVVEPPRRQGRQG
ncbi:pyridoxal-dependent decarboxylase, exosortase A system-associated [Deferrisoma camini]|uniref:pyridoxal-dependent decarboxylase, exosortase A system-associated n=1 Tax=Deferrisoma camini TaxID=1035120 RepID=UPI00046D8349|nr:pyridoxal-dependent decarboxylase, exosortase A system-associated [Deferrisoma camini]